MAVAFEGFSIREYAAKMRSVNVAKCWPFSGNSEEINGDEVEPVLPPITVTKFRWWAHELNNITNIPQQQPEEEEDPKLHTAIEGEKVNMDVFTVPKRMASSSTKSKSRAQKKRSIVEIFAVAPQIEKIVDEDDDTGEEEEEELNLMKIDRRKKKVEMVNKLMDKNRKKNMVTMIKKKKTKKKKMKNMKKKLGNNNCKEESIANKGKIKKMELQTPSNFTRKLRGSLNNKEFAKGVLDTVATGRRKAGLKCLSIQKKPKFARKFKMVKKHQKPVLSVHGILKNNTKCLSLQNAINCRTPGAVHLNHYGIQHLEKHVRFSGKDDILGSKDIPSFEQRICISDAFTAPPEEEQSVGSGTEIVTVEENRSDEDDVSIIKESAGPASTVKKLTGTCDLVDIPSFPRMQITCQEKVKNLPDTAASKGQVAIHGDDVQMFDPVNLSGSNCSPFTGIPRLVCSLQDVRQPPANSQVLSNVSRASSSRGKFVEFFKDHSHVVTAMNSTTNAMAFPQPASFDSSIDENVNGRVPFTLLSAPQNITGHHMRYHPYESPRELIGSLSVSEWKQKATAFRQKHMNEEFSGLPLNSLGELIQGSSSAKGRFNHLKHSSLPRGSSSILPLHNYVPPRITGDNLILQEKRSFPKDQLNLFPSLNENPNRHLPARLGVTESVPAQTADVHWLNSERRSSHCAHPLDSELNMMSISSGWRKKDQFQSQKINGPINPRQNSDHVFLSTTQPTMRLMGKDVAIGRSSEEMQGFDDGKVWTDKEIIAEHHSTGTSVDKSSLERHCLQDRLLHPAVGKSKEKSAQPQQIRSHQTSQSNISMQAPEYGLFHPYPDWRTNAMTFSHSLNVNRVPSPPLHHFSLPPTSPSIFNRDANFQEPNVSGTETISICSQHPLPFPHNTSQNLDWRPTELKGKQNLLQASKSTFNFPFLPPDCNEHFFSSWHPSSCKSLISWLLNATQQIKPPVTASQHPSGVYGNYHFDTAGDTFLRSSPASCSPVPSYSQDPMTSHSQKKSSLGAAYVSHHPPVTLLPGIKPAPLDRSCGNRILKSSDRMKSKAFAVKNFDDLLKTKKRPINVPDYSTKSNKMPNLGKQNDLSAAKKLTGDSIGREIPDNAQSLDLDLRKDEASNVESALNETQKDGLGTPTGIDYSKIPVVGRSGPIKLTAGAKHILKPSQNMDQDNSTNMDQDNSRPTHSTIPFAAANDFGGLPESQKKSAKIYKF